MGRVQFQAFDLSRLFPSSNFQKRDGHQGHDQPDDDAYRPGSPRILPAHVCERLHDGHEANHAQNREEVDAAVQVDIEDVGHDPTGDVSEDPVGIHEIVSGSEGQRAHHHQIRYKEIEHEDVDWRKRCLSSQCRGNEEEQGHEVANKPKGKDEQIDNWVDGVLEFTDGAVIRVIPFILMPHG